MKNNNKISFVLTAVLVLSLLFGCSPEEKSITKTGFYFDTIITITLYGTDNEKYIGSCFSLASDYERKFSSTIKDSEISQINESPGKYVTVSDETIELLQDGISSVSYTHLRAHETSV